MSPSPQHSRAPQHRQQKSQGAGRRSPPSCASAVSQVFIWGQRGNSCGRSRGAHVLPLALPCTLPYLFPSSQESVVSLLPIYYDCISARPPPPLWGGGGGTRPCLLHFFYLGTVPDKITSVRFFTASVPDCFLSDMVCLHAHVAGIIRFCPLAHSELETRERQPAFKPGIQPQALPSCPPKPEGSQQLPPLDTAKFRTPWKKTSLQEQYLWAKQRANVQPWLPQTP